jgi:hypothetical protein
MEENGQFPVRLHAMFRLLNRSGPFAVAGVVAGGLNA